MHVCYGVGRGKYCMRKQNHHSTMSKIGWIGGQEKIFKNRLSIMTKFYLEKCLKFTRYIKNMLFRNVEK